MTIEQYCLVVLLLSVLWLEHRQYMLSSRVETLEKALRDVNEDVERVGSDGYHSYNDTDKRLRALEKGDRS